MEIATVINIHSKPDVVLDTLESLQMYMTPNILAVTDGASREFEQIPLPVSKIKGFNHNCPRAPFRNVALGLKSLVESYQKMDWYCYIEYDCLVTSSRFKKSLEMAEEMGIWMLGNDGHVDTKYIPLIDSLVGADMSKHNYYLLGACQFFHKNFIAKLIEINFFDRFLNLTNAFTEPGVFPYYTGYDLSEHMYPTMCRYFGGNIGVFATWHMNQWHGSYEVFPIRWKPELDPETENFPNASILHPVKCFHHPIREHHRNKRKEMTNGTVVQETTSDRDHVGPVCPNEAE